MKQLRTVMCLLTALTLCLGTAACGQKSEEEVSLTSQSAALLSGSDSQAETETTEAEDDEDEDDDEDDDAPVDVKKVTVKKSTSATTSGTTAVKSETTTTTAKSADSSKSDSDKKSSGSKSTSSKSSGSSQSTTAAANASNATTTAATEAATEATTEAMTDPAPEADATAEEKVVAGVIDFNTNTYEGDGIVLNGATYTITTGGTYILTGSLTGMVEVNTVEKVKLKLNGVDINNPGGPAILCTDAKKLTLTLIEGTANYLTDGYSGVYDGCICTNDTLEIKGAGMLNVNGTVEHGISSDDDIIIKNGDITVTAIKSGMVANDDITVSGSTLRVTGNTNGIKSKGTLHISGGTVFAYGGGTDKSGLYSGAAFTLTGGYVYAVGCGNAQPDAGTSTQCSICVRYNTDLPAGSWATINCNGMQFLNETSPYTFNTVFLSTPDVYDGMTYAVFANGVQCGEELVTAGIASAVAVDVP